MSIKALQDYTFYAKYARYRPDLNRRETWSETIDRVFDMHKRKYANELAQSNELVELFAFCKKALNNKKVLGSQRAMQFGGDPILSKNERLYNCTVSYIDRPRFFQECMFVLLAGCGAGFSVQYHHIAKLPLVNKRDKGSITYTIEDSIEGWANAVGALMSSYFVDNQPFPEYYGYEIEFDGSKIRPAGAVISWGGIAPGSKGLLKSLEKIRFVIDRRLKNKADDLPCVLRPIDAYDITMHISDAVLSGGIRRSATICVFSIDDNEMMNAKIGDWFRTDPQRGRSNNSVMLVRGEVSKKQFTDIFESVKQFGEPGFIWSAHRDVLFNPCLTGDTIIETASGPLSLKQIVEDIENDIIHETLSFNEDTGEHEWNTITAGLKTKTNTNVIKLTLEDGRVLKLTPDHLVYTTQGYVPAGQLTDQHEIVVTQFDQSTFCEHREQTKVPYIDSSKWTNRMFENINEPELKQWKQIQLELPKLK